MHSEKVLILDFGSQYTQLIARRVRELNIYCEIHPYKNYKSLIDNFKAIILSGSPASCYLDNAPTVEIQEIINAKPTLGICYGAQIIAHQLGGKVENIGKREFGKASLECKSNDIIFNEINNNSQVWMSHGDSITQLPINATLLGSTNDVENAIFKLNASENPVYGIQFHPEVVHSISGKQFLSNFLIEICKVKPDWTPDTFIQESIDEIKVKVKDENVILGLSGGVDSSVAALLLHKAIGKQLFCIFIDNGLLRKNEFENVLLSYQHIGLNVIGIQAKEEFLTALKDISDPEQKRKTIGRVFIEVFERESRKIPNAKWLAQGTIYPDVIESVSVHGPSVTIKSHHNVGGLPEKMGLKLLEPLRLLFKDEVRKIGNALHLPHPILHRHPFPGPGLAVRILGDITKEKVQMLQEADDIFLQHLHKSGEYNKIWQAGVILLPVKSVGVMGDERTYESAVALRAVNSTDGMTAEWSHIPYEVLAAVSSDIINKVKGINRVVYDISTKPPATIEWE